MLRHFAEITPLAAVANMPVNRSGERPDDFQERPGLARNLQPQPLQLVSEVGLPRSLQDLGQQPKCVGKPLVGRRSFESVLSGVGARGGIPPDVSSLSNEADDLLPLVRFRKRTKANVTRRPPLRRADQRQLGSVLKPLVGGGAESNSSFPNGGFDGTLRFDGRRVVDHRTAAAGSDFRETELTEEGTKVKS